MVGYYSFPTLSHMFLYLSGVKDTSWGVHVKAAMKRLRKLATHFHCSSQALGALKRLCEAMGIDWRAPVQDVVTRWWSTYLLLASILHLEAVIRAYGPKLPGDLQLTETDWLICRRAAALLEPFMEVRKTLEGDKYVTGSLCIPMIHDLREGLKEACEPEDLLPSSSVEERAAEATLCETAKAMLKMFTEKFGDGSKIVHYTEVHRQS